MSRNSARGAVLRLVPLLCVASVAAVVPVALPRPTAHFAAPGLAAGAYRATVDRGPTIYHATWDVTVSRTGSVRGRSEWACCSGERIDRVVGHSSGDHVVIVRHCTVRGAPYCMQTYAGVVSGRTVRGRWTGTGSIAGASTFVLTLVG